MSSHLDKMTQAAKFMCPVFQIAVYCGNAGLDITAKSFAILIYGEHKAGVTSSSRQRNAAQEHQKGTDACLILVCLVVFLKLSTSEEVVLIDRNLRATYKNVPDSQQTDP
jgi:hypothetical protein